MQPIEVSKEVLELLYDSPYKSGILVIKNEDGTNIVKFEDN